MGKDILIAIMGVFLLFILIVALGSYLIFSDVIIEFKMFGTCLVIVGGWTIGYICGRLARK